LNKPNHPPAGVLGISADAFLSPGVSVEALPYRLGQVGKPEPTTLLGRCRKAVLRLSAVVAEAAPRAWTANLLRSLRGRNDWRGAWYKRGALAIKYVLRSACMPASHGRFLQFVHAHPQMMAYRRRDPRLLERHMHRYVNAHWHRRQRLRSLHQHYRFALGNLPEGLFDLVYGQGHACLGSLIAKDGTLLTLCMCPPIFMGCEGELCLQLCDVNEAPLYSIVFSIVGENRPRIAIGCLQGPKGDDARDVVRALTRNLHGMRPKQLMLSLVYAFARRYGIRDIVAIGNEAHPLRRTGRPVLSDYDAFWTEQQGAAIAGGWYALPASPHRKPEAEVPSQHRSAFRRREALRLQAEQTVMDALGHRQPKQAEPLVQRPLSAYKPQHEFRERSWAS
jgi:uncharacterized protein